MALMMMSSCSSAPSISPLFIIITILCFSTQLPPIATAQPDNGTLSIGALNHRQGDHQSPTSPHLSPSSTLYQDYQRMISTFKIYAYPSNTTVLFNHTAPSSPSLFHSSLVRYAASHHSFLTQDPVQAHLFYISFPPTLSPRSLAREIGTLRSSHPYWDRSLGADHVFLSSCGGAAPSSSRNVVELRKNAVQITCFTSPAGRFIPHKDVSLPPYPLTGPFLPTAMNHTSRREKNGQRLGYFKWSDPVHVGSDLLKGLEGDPDFVIETQRTDGDTYVEMMETSRFCLFVYVGEVSGLVEAMAYGCVPVVISVDSRPIQDMPLTDVLSWQEMAVFVGASVGPKGLKRLLLKDVGEDGNRYDRMRGLAMAAAKHLMWNDPPQPYDAFHMVMYQLWLRRHAVRYSTWGKKQGLYRKAVEN